MIENKNYNAKAVKDCICLALDMEDEKEILDCVNELSDLVGYFKLNYSFTKYGPDLIKKILSYGVKIFLDLKIHDIPNTAAGYAENIVRLGVHIVTVHTTGGYEMMNQIANTSKIISRKLNVEPPLIIGVTLLTSIDQKTMNSELNIQGNLDLEVNRRAVLASKSGLDGIVCSPNELPKIKSSLPDYFFYVTPGVRGEGISSHDHKRTTTYTDAINYGSKLLVVGREILESGDRRKTVLNIGNEISGMLK